MTEQYKIGEFIVDLSRNQITQDKQPQIIPPKALAVLTYLAKNQGKVISQDELLDKVWTDTIVSPNTLQRSIAQLRKALGDDGKEQTYIKTHSKQGYSLEQNVQWLTQDNASSSFTVSNKPTHQPNAAQNEEKPHIDKSILKKTLLGFTLSFLLVSTLLGTYFLKQQSKPFSIGQIRALTATDGKEVASIYSPDGNFIIFHRFSEDKCVNNVWAKNLSTQQEYKLTDNIDVYKQHSFSPDGSKLVLIRALDCIEPVTQKECYQLTSIDFQSALREPQIPNLIIECKDSEIRRPSWLQNGDIALMQKQAERWQLISYSPTNNKSDVLYKVENGTIYYYDYSAELDLFAITVIRQSGQRYIDVITSNGELLSSNQIIVPEKIKGYRYIRPNFSPIKDKLIFSTGHQLFTLNFDGQIDDISIPVDEPFSSPHFHPDGNKGIVIKGFYDSDVNLINLRNKQTQTIERSTKAENNAVFQPQGNLIAFKSSRSGEAQVWLTDQTSTTQLSHFLLDTYISGINWSHDGQRLLVSANDQLFEISLDGAHSPITTQYPVTQLFHYDSKGNFALVLGLINGTNMLCEVNLMTGSMEILTDKRVNWAIKSNSGEIFFTDHMDAFWVSGPLEFQRIPELDNLAADKKRFLLRESTIFALNNEHQLLSYHVEEKQYKIIQKVSNNIDDITDINNSELLATIKITSKKEVVELLLN